MSPHITEKECRELSRLAYRLRKEAVGMVHRAKTGHAAPALSIAELLATLYFRELKIDPENPRWTERDVMILSKGHACPIYYAALAERGFFPKEWLKTYRNLDSRLQGHPVMGKVPGVDITTGSLGNGLSLGVGKALSARRHKRDNYVYVILGDGEIQEGLVWESAMFSGYYRLDRIIAFIDRNGLQSGGNVSSIMNLDPLPAKWEAFGWHVQTIDGHDVGAIANAVRAAKQETGKPSLIVANTVKGKGVSYMEGQYLWHMKAPTDAEYEQALRELSEAEARHA